MLVVQPPVSAYPASSAVVAYSPPRQAAPMSGGYGAVALASPQQEAYLRQQQMMTPPPHQRSLSHYTPPTANTSATYHRVHEDVEPISPYPELKNLVGQLHLARHRDPRHHPPPHGHHAHPHSGHHAHAPPGHHVSTTITTPQEQRQEVKLPDFPFHHWVDDPREHQYRPTYEQLFYATWEHRQKMDAEAKKRAQEEGQNQQFSDMDALDAAIAGGRAHLAQPGADGVVSTQELLASIKTVVEAKRHEAERATQVAAQYQKERGPSDPATLEAQQAATMAEGQARGAAGVEHAVEVVPAPQAAEHISATVQAFDQERQHTHAVWMQTAGEFGEQDQRTLNARTAALLAAAQWQGATAAQAAPGQRDVVTAEHPQAIANRANLAADALRSQVEELQRKAAQDAHLYGEKDPRTVEARKAADAAKAEFRVVEHTAATAQAVADGKPPPPPLDEPKKKPKKRTQRGFCG